MVRLNGRPDMTVAFTVDVKQQRNNNFCNHSVICCHSRTYETADCQKHLADNGSNIYTPLTENIRQSYIEEVLIIATVTLQPKEMSQKRLIKQCLPTIRLLLQSDQDLTLFAVPSAVYSHRRILKQTSSILTKEIVGAN